jgi:hypothetical protein
MFIKVFVSGGIIEVKEYDRLNTAKLECDPDQKSAPGESVDNDLNYSRRNQIRRDTIRRLVCQNFDNSAKFVTLTFADTDQFDIKDPIQCNQAFAKFRKRIKKKFGNFKHVAVIEFQDKNDRGAVHYHCFMDLPYLAAKELEQIWGYGFIKINAITHVDNLGAYVIKYMTKDTEDPRLKGIKAEGLDRPTELCSWKPDQKQKILKMIEDLKNTAPVYSAKYNSENAGNVTYLQFNINRKLSK